MVYPHCLGSVGQSCVPSPILSPPSCRGHSGSGKTEAARKILEFLRSLGQKPMEANSAQVRAGWRHLPISMDHFPKPVASHGSAPKVFQCQGVRLGFLFYLCFIVIGFVLFKVGFLCVVLAILELSLQTKLALNSHLFACLCLLNMVKL